jgi:nucleoside-diphosphate-sugar epimerase
MTGGEQERDFIYVDDVVDGVLAAAEAPGIDGNSIDLGTGVAVSVRRVVETIWKMAPGEGSICLGVVPYRRGEAWRLCADAERTARLMGWRASTSLDAGLRKTIDEF